MIKHTLYACTALVVAGQSAPVLAQAATEEQAGDTRLLGDIVVTAQRREQNIQDVPVSISAFSGDSLDQLGVKRSGELANVVPGLVVGQPSGPGSQLIIFLRGAGISDYNTNNAGPVGVYADDVYISSPVLTSFQFFDVERLEILKGPQGTLYGRNVTGGAIKIISKKPGDEFALDATATYSSFNTTSLEAGISVPVGEKVGTRFAFKKDDSDGFTRNATTGKRVNGTDMFAWRGIVDVEPTDNFRIRANIHGATNSSQVAGYHQTGTLDAAGNRCSDADIVARLCTDLFGYSGPADPYKVNYLDIKNIDHDSIGGYLETELDLGDVTLTTVSAYDRAQHLLIEDSDSGPSEILELGFGVDSDTYSQEVRLSGDSGKLKWVGGAYYLQETLRQDQYGDVFRGLRAFTGGVSDPDGAITGAPVLFIRANNRQKTKTFAAFGQGTLEVTDRLNLTLGGRWTYEKKTFRSLTVLEDDVLFAPTGTLELFDIVPRPAKAKAFSWRAAVDYKLADDVMVYGSASRGFKSGGYSGGLITDPAQAPLLLEPFDPEYVNAYEVGVKSEFFDRNLRLNFSAFYNDYSDLQVFASVNTNIGVIQILDNASSARVYGFEFDATAYPVEGLTLALNGAYINTKLVDFQALSTGDDLSGNEIPRTPEKSLSALARYEFNLGSVGKLGVQGFITYKSHQWTTSQNQRLQEIGANTIVNARIDYRHSSDRWGLAFFVNNVTDKAVPFTVGDLGVFGSIQTIYAPPRVFGVELNVNL